MTVDPTKKEVQEFKDKAYAEFSMVLSDEQAVEIMRELSGQSQLDERNP